MTMFGDFSNNNIKKTIQPIFINIKTYTYFKIYLILLELISHNINLVDRLKNKLKVSTFFNNIENRKKNILKNLLYHQIKISKTGLIIKIQ